MIALETLRELPDAFHGTSYTEANQIIAGGFKVSVNPGNMLGDGVYFWDGQLGKAKQWARRHCRERDESQMAVVQSHVQLGKCLNLTDYDHVDMLRTLVSTYQGRGKTITQVTAIDILADKVGVDTVKACRPTRNTTPILAGSPFPEDIEIMICVRNLKKILSSAIVWTGEI